MAGLAVFLAGVAAGAVSAAAVATALARRAQRIGASRRSELAHDLRTPLASIAAFTEILQDDPAAGQRYLDIIHQEAGRLDRLIGQRLGAPPARDRVEPAKEVGPAAMSAPPGRRVLVVDDDRYIVEATRAVLSRAGFHALGALDGEEALRQARDQRPDLILMDLTMPGLPGSETMRRLRSDPATRDIPVIITTGAGPDGAPEGAAAVLSKPISRETLLDAVARAIPEGR